MPSSCFSLVCLTDWHPTSPRCTLVFVFLNLLHWIIVSSRKCSLNLLPPEILSMYSRYYLFLNQTESSLICLHNHFIVHNSFIRYQDSKHCQHVPSEGPCSSAQRHPWYSWLGDHSGQTERFLSILVFEPTNGRKSIMKIQPYILYTKCHRAVKVTLAMSLDYHNNTTLE